MAQISFDSMLVRAEQHVRKVRDDSLEKDACLACGNCILVTEHIDHYYFQGHKIDFTLKPCESQKLVLFYS